MVYVDDPRPCIKSRRWPYNWSAHLFADTEAELHTLAKKIGLKRAWFQEHARLPHYDVTLAMRVKAIKAGARRWTGRSHSVGFTEERRASMKRKQTASKAKRVSTSNVERVFAYGAVGGSMPKHPRTVKELYVLVEEHYKHMGETIARGAVAWQTEIFKLGGVILALERRIEDLERTTASRDLTVHDEERHYVTSVDISPAVVAAITDGAAPGIESEKYV